MTEIGLKERDVCLLLRHLDEEEAKEDEEGKEEEEEEEAKERKKKAKPELSGSPISNNGTLFLISGGSYE